MPNEEQPGDGDGGDGERRTKEERQTFADVVLHWTHSVNSLRALVDAWDVSITALQGTRAALDGRGRNRQIAAALRSIDHLDKAERLTFDTREHLRKLIAALSKESGLIK